MDFALCHNLESEPKSTPNGSDIDSTKQAPYAIDNHYHLHLIIGYGC